MTKQPSDTTTRRKFLLTSGALGVAGLAGCTTSESGGDGGGNGDGNGGETTADGGDQQLSGDIAIAGSSTVFPIASAVAEEFQKEHSEVNISVQSTGSGGGFQNFFCKGETDFNNASRPIKKEEESLCEEGGVEWVELNVATDAVTVVVNNENDFVDCMTPDQLAQIWGPDAAENWSDVNSEWPDEKIERYGAAETSGTFDYFTEAIVGEEGAHTKDYQATEDDNTIVQGVSGSKYAIGYFGFSFFVNNKDKVKALGIDNGDGCVKPSLETAKSGEYKPLARPLFTYPAKASLEETHVAEFARFFVEQSANQELIADQIGYVPNSEEDMNAELEKLNAAIDEAQS
jgi:phosphate transport system substrate-binding protein